MTVHCSYTESSCERAQRVQVSLMPHSRSFGRWAVLIVATAAVLAVIVISSNNSEVSGKSNLISSRNLFVLGTNTFESLSFSRFKSS